MRQQAQKFYIEYLDGDPDSFAELVRLLTPRFYRMFRHLGADALDAEDQCQEFFLALYRSGASFSRERDFMPWAYAIARNIYLKDIERSQKIKIVPLFEWIAVRDGRSDESGIEVILSNISKEKRIVFELKHFQGLRFHEIAEVLDIPEGTVKSRMFAALTELRQIISRRGL